MKFCILILLFVFVERNASQMVRQCLCSELDECRQKHREQMLTCVFECKANLKSDMIAKGQAIAQCMMEMGGGNEGPGMGCFSSLRTKMCTNVPGTMIPQQSEGAGGRFGGRFGGMGGAGNGAGGGFLQRLRERWGGGNQESHPFLKCMMECRQRISGGQHVPPHVACGREKGCSVLKPSPMEFFQTFRNCRSQMQDKKQRLCDCLNRNGETELCQAIMNRGGFGMMG